MEKIGSSLTEYQRNNQNLLSIFNETSSLNISFKEKYNFLKSRNNQLRENNEELRLKIDSIKKYFDQKKQISANHLLLAEQHFKSLDSLNNISENSFITINKIFQILKNKNELELKVDKFSFTNNINRGFKVISKYKLLLSSYVSVIILVLKTIKLKQCLMRKKFLLIQKQKNILLVRIKIVRSIIESVKILILRKSIRELENFLTFTIEQINNVKEYLNVVKRFTSDVKRKICLKKSLAIIIENNKNLKREAGKEIKRLKERFEKRTAKSVNDFLRKRGVNSMFKNEIDGEFIQKYENTVLELHQKYLEKEKKIKKIFRSNVDLQLKEINTCKKKTKKKNKKNK